tara:strand:- start:105 stop:305 length:201 start_codon:yes stop_codon:yes gene_type:complete
MIEYLKALKMAIMFPEGEDKQFDEECNQSLIIFLDRIYYFALFGLITFGVFSLYFFIKYEILKNVL